MSEMEARVAAWRSNKQPSVPHEFDALVELFTVNSDTVFGLITYNGANGCYECEPCCIDKNNDHRMVELEMYTDLYHTIQRKLNQLGIHHFIRMTEAGKSKPPRKSTLPANLFPTIIG